MPNYDSLVKAVSQFAPLLGSIIGGPAGGAIGGIIAHEFGGDINNPDDLASRIVSDPNAQVKIIEIQNNTKVQLQQIIAQQAQAELVAQTAQVESDRLDRADARKNNTENKSIMPHLVSFMIIIGFFGAGYLLLAGGQTKSDAQVLFMMLGTLATAFGGVINYWLGSSSSSKSKDEAIHTTLANLSNSP